MSTDLDELVAQLHASSDPAPVPRDLLARVRAGGRRRLRRRRTGAVALAAALTVVLAVGVPALVPRPGYDRTAATAGQLAGDRALAAQAVAAWDASHSRSDNASRGIFDDLRGPARVVWLGSTPGGLAAVVAQDAVLHEHGDLAGDDVGTRTLYGFLGDDGTGTLRVVGDDYRPEGVPAVAGWFVDPARTWLAVLLQGHAYSVSSEWTYQPDGVARRGDWRPVPEVAGGVGVVQVSPGTVPRLSRQPHDDPGDVRAVTGILTVDLRDGQVDRRLQWGGPDLKDTLRQVGGPYPGPVPQLFADPLSAALEDRLRDTPDTEGDGLWLLAGSVPDGRRLIVTERQLDADPSRVYALLGDTVLDAGPVDPRAALPVRVHLPDAQGWVIASYGAQLRWRSTAHPAWTTLPSDAALLPEQDGIVVQVQQPGQPATQVPLQP